jgi:hypothetical protein
VSQRGGGRLHSEKVLVAQRSRSRTAYGSSGTTSVFNLTDYNHKVGSSQSDYSTMYAAMVDFETNTAVC